MRVIGRTQSGQIVGYFERHADEVVCEQIDAGFRHVAQVVLEGFRESVNWLYGLGAARLEIVG